MIHESRRPAAVWRPLEALVLLATLSILLFFSAQIAAGQKPALAAGAGRTEGETPIPGRPLVFPDLDNIYSPVDAVVGTKATIAGWFNIIWGDGLPGSSQSKLLYTLTDGNGEVIRFAPAANFTWPAGGPTALNGDRVIVEGVRVETTGKEGADPVLLAETIRPDHALAGLETINGSVAGSQPWVSVLCKFADVPNEPKPLSFFQDMYRSSYPGLDHYWREVSYDAANVLNSNAVGWYTLPHPRSYYVNDWNSDGQPEASLDRLADDCIATSDQDVLFPEYVGINLMFNDRLDCCAWGGSRTMTLDGYTKSWRVTWDPPWAFGNMTVMKHEMGHGFGLPHSSGDYGLTYDNEWDVMSNAWSNCSAAQDPTYGCLGQHTISFHKDELGWIPAGQKLLITGTGYLTVTLEQLALPQTDGYKMVQIPIQGSPSRFYTIESRRKVGYDFKLPGQAVIIHEVDLDRDEPAHIVDMDGNGDTGDAGAMWTVGEAFTTTFGITVTVTSSTTTGFVLGIDVGSLAPFDCDTQAELPAAECEALVALYNNNGGYSWANNTDWLKTPSPCSWFGVTCSAGHVSRLVLYNNQLTGPIPAELGNLSNLLFLNLSGNRLEGTLPPEMGGLTSLQYLYLYNNQLKGPIPSELGNLTSLKYIDLYSNRLDGPIPAELGNLTNLQYLLLDSNQLSGPIPAELGSLTNLRYLYLFNNRLSDSLPAELGDLANLRYLYLFNNALGGDVPSSIMNLAQLSGAGIGYNKLSASDPAVSSFLSAKDPEWATNQTVPPVDIQVAGVTTNTVTLSWAPILYTGDDGYYEVSYAPTTGGPYTVHGVTSDKHATSYVVDGLDSGTEYIFIIRTYTPAHGYQKNDLWSAYSQEVFKITLAKPPATPVLSSPAGVTFSTMNTYVWGEATGADEYQLLVVGDYANQVHNEWYQAIDICSEGACQVTTLKPLAYGPYVWYVQARNPSGSTWSSGQRFRIAEEETPLEFVLLPLILNQE